MNRAMIWLAAVLMSVVAQAASFDVYEPKGKPVRATVVFLHGGAWQSGDKAQYASMAPTFTAQGLRFVSANYRLSSVAQHPAPIDDLEKILKESKWDHVFLLGHSAGAHMIAFWNTAHTNPRVRGFVGLEGIYDIPALVKKWPTYKDWFIAKEFGTEAKWPAASPSLLSPLAKTPWLLIHSAKDELVELAQTEEFAKHLRDAEAPATSVVLKTESHFGAVESLSAPTSDASRAVLKFVDANS